MGIEFDIENVNIGEAFKQDTFAFHHRLAGEGADVAEAEHGRTVADDGDEISLCGVLEGVLRVLLDFEARLGDARRVGEA